jgi:hypothetical protein
MAAFKQSNERGVLMCVTAAANIWSAILDNRKDVGNSTFCGSIRAAPQIAWDHHRLSCAPLLMHDIINTRVWDALAGRAASGAATSSFTFLDSA